MSSGSTNFLLWSGVTPFNNSESDTAYVGDATRQNGAVSGPFSPQLANKFFGQESLFTNAVIQLLIANGFSPNDGSANPSTALANLQAVFAAAFILSNSAAFSVSPTAPTPAAGDNSSKLATTAFIQNLLAASIGFAPVRSTLSYSVTVPLNTQTNIISVSVTFPSVGGPFRADIRYGAFVTTGGNVAVTAVKDSASHMFAPCGSNFGGLGKGCHAGSEISSNTYVAGATVTFTLVASGNAGGGYTVDPTGYETLSPNPSTFLEVTPILA